jgi:hypothetical protein
VNLSNLLNNPSLFSIVIFIEFGSYKVLPVFDVALIQNTTRSKATLIKLPKCPVSFVLCLVVGPND